MNFTYTTFFARDVDKMAAFYIALGLHEIESSRSEYYREVSAGSAKIGFTSQAAYQTLGMPDESNPTGVRSVITLDVGSPDDVEPTVAKAVAAGGELVKPAFKTTFGQYLAVVRDPEGNVFRLAAAVTQ
ncbi:MAG: VOC family protein [Alphaproteobacteria bacterium]